MECDIYMGIVLSAGVLVRVNCSDIETEDGR